MQTITPPSELLTTLQQFEVFEGIAEADLQWLIDRSEYLTYKTGEYLFEPEEEVHHMQIMIKGNFLIIQGNF